jgi:hypothetical protein
LKKDTEADQCVLDAAACGGQLGTVSCDGFDDCDPGMVCCSQSGGGYDVLSARCLPKDNCAASQNLLCDPEKAGQCPDAAPCQRFGGTALAYSRCL